MKTNILFPNLSEENINVLEKLRDSKPILDFEYNTEISIDYKNIYLADLENDKYSVCYADIRCNGLLPFIEYFNIFSGDNDKLYVSCTVRPKTSTFISMEPYYTIEPVLYLSLTSTPEKEKEYHYEIMKNIIKSKIFTNEFLYPNLFIQSIMDGRYVYFVVNMRDRVLNRINTVETINGPLVYVDNNSYISALLSFNTNPNISFFINVFNRVNEDMDLLDPELIKNTATDHKVLYYNYIDRCVYELKYNKNKELERV